MHISEQQKSPNTILTKCTKMTEETHRRHGMNGNDSGAAAAAAVTVKEECPTRNNYRQGGRLKFFKDGKFILELERTREGERVSWVPVPRKTFWPPQGTAASTPSYRQESSTSLSVSDDNSSIQSSPWQRDHSWKQTTPRRNLSKEMSFYFWRASSSSVRNKQPRSRKCRRPYSSTPEPQQTVKNSGGSSSSSSSSSRTKVCNNQVNKRRGLMVIVQNLIDKCAASTPPRAEMVVSPRKRFLREMEKDKIQSDDACQKRSRNKTQSTIPGTSSTTTTTTIITTPSSQNTTTTTTTTNTSSSNSSPPNTRSPVNGSTVVVMEEARASRNSNYSITSLLSEDRSTATTKRCSPEANSPSHYAAAVAAATTRPQYCSPTPPSEDGWYSESVDRLRSIELSQVDKRALSGYNPYPFMSPYVFPYSTLPPSYYPPPPPGLYSRSYMVTPVYTAPPLPVTVRHESPSCSWVAEPTRDPEHKDTNVTDMPLNLSKHAS